MISINSSSHCFMEVRLWPLVSRYESVDAYLDVVALAGILTLPHLTAQTCKFDHRHWDGQGFEYSKFLCLTAITC